MNSALDWQWTMVQGVASLESKWAEVHDEWVPDEPPRTILAGALGEACVLSSEGISDGEMERICEVVERVLDAGTEAQKDEATTGFLEGVAAALDREPEKKRIVNFLGLRAKNYMKHWDEFCGL